MSLQNSKFCSKNAIFLHSKFKNFDLGQQEDEDSDSDSDDEEFSAAFEEALVAKYIGGMAS